MKTLRLIKFKYTEFSIATFLQKKKIKNIDNKFDVLTMYIYIYKIYHRKFLVTICYTKQKENNTFIKIDIIFIQRKFLTSFHIKKIRDGKLFISQKFSIKNMLCIDIIFVNRFYIYFQKIFKISLIFFHFQQKKNFLEKF